MSNIGKDEKRITVIRTPSKIPAAPPEPKPLKEPIREKEKVPA